MVRQAAWVDDAHRPRLAELVILQERPQYQQRGSRCGIRPERGDSSAPERHGEGGVVRADPGRRDQAGGRAPHYLGRGKAGCGGQPRPPCRAETTLGPDAESPAS
jgi:hypothetical protein